MNRGTQRTTKVVLPSGKTIDVVSFDSGEGRELSRDLDLEICTACGSHLVYPVSWSAIESDYWKIELRCPECEHRWSGTYHDRDAQRFDAKLDAATETIVADLRRMVRAEMEDSVERFVTALDAGAILPEDF